MRSFYRRRGRSAFAALFMAALAVSAGRTWRTEGGIWMFALALLMTLGAAKAALDAANKQAALRFDHCSIWFGKTWGGIEEIPWRKVHDVSMRMLTVRYMGLIPVGRHVFITLTCEGGTFGARRFRISARTLGMSRAEAAQMFAALKQAHLDAVGEAGAAMAAAGSRGWGVDMGSRSTDQDFDADRALARYLADKETGEPLPQAATGPARPQAPLRSSFGRRVS